MAFRAIQALSTSTLLLMWAVRSIAHPQKFHPMLLVMAVVVALVSEVSYRAGKSAADKEDVKRS